MESGYWDLDNRGVLFNGTIPMKRIFLNLVCMNNGDIWFIGRLLPVCTYVSQINQVLHMYCGGIILAFALHGQDSIFCFFHCHEIQTLRIS